MDLGEALKREALRQLDGPTLFRVALALRRQTREQAGRSLGITSSAVAMYLDPGEARAIGPDLAERVESAYGVPATAWKRPRKEPKP